MLKTAGIITNKQTFLRYVREGRIKGEIRYKRDGYRFKEENIKTFIDFNKTYQQENPLEELERLRKENKELRHRLKVPDSMIQAENLKLTEKIRQLEEEKENWIHDNTIRIKVE